MPTAFTHDPNMGVPSSTTNTGIATWSGTTGGTLLSSGVTIDSSNNMTVPGYLYLSGDEKELRFYEGSNFVAIKTNSSLAGDYTLTLPLNDGGADEFLQTNGSGVLTWAAASGGVDTTGTPANNQIAIFTDADTLEGVAGLTFDGTLMYLTGTGISTIQRTTSGTTSISAPVHISNKTSQDAADGFGPVINFQMTDTGVTDQQMGYLGYRRDGADNSARFMITTSNGGTVAEKFSISSAGEVTMPSQPSFIAKLTTSQTNVTGNTILFRSDNAANSQWNIMENRGSGFANGKFTAPVAGLYQFSLIINLEGLTSAMSYYNLVFYTDTPAANISITSENPWTQCYTPSGNLLTRWAMLVEMDANDYAYFGGYVYYGSQVVDLQPSTFFSGYLVA